MKQLSYEESVKAAEPIKAIAELARTLDVEYLTEAVKSMKDNRSFRESALILAPNPHAAMSKNDLDRMKLKGLELMLELAKNQEQILMLTIDHAKQQGQSSEIAQMFGL